MLASLIVFYFLAQMRLLILLLCILQSAQPCAPPQACAGQCGPNQWVIACRSPAECGECPAGTTSPKGSWSINQCVGCPAGTYTVNGRTTNQAALNAAIARNRYFCRIYNLGCASELRRNLGVTDVADANDALTGLLATEGLSTSVNNSPVTYADHYLLPEALRDALALRAASDAEEVLERGLQAAPSPSPLCPSTMVRTPVQNTLIGNIDIPVTSYVLEFDLMPLPGEIFFFPGIVSNPLVPLIFFPSLSVPFVTF